MPRDSSLQFNHYYSIKIMNQLDLQGGQQRTLGNIIRLQANSVPNITAIITGNSRYSYRELNDRANSYAAGFSALGVKHNDTVCILMESCPEFIFAVYGLSKLGAIWVPVNTDYRGEWLSSTFTDSLAKVLLTDAKYFKKVQELPSTGFDSIVVHGLDTNDAHSLNDAEVSALSNLEKYSCKEYLNEAIYYGDTAAVTWTSGTTGRSKGVMLSHSNWITSAESSCASADFQPGDVVYNCLPLYNAAAWTANIFRAHYAGVTLAFDDHFSVGNFWQRIRFFNATHTMTLGSMAIFIWNLAEQNDDSDNTLRHAMMVPIPEDLIDPFKKRFGMQTIHSHSYGQSEAMVTMVPPLSGKLGRKANCLGVEAPTVEVTLLDDDDQPTPQGEVGELCVRPRKPYAIFNGYFNDPETTNRTLRNLWHHTGDLGRKDKDGDYFFADRKADFIRYKGRNISSVQVEGVMRKHPAIADIAIFGITSEELKSEAEIMAAVILNEGQSISAEKLARFVNDNAPYFFVPRYIEFVQEFPTTPNGKIQKYKLRDKGISSNTWDAKKANFKVNRD